jgi:hypothetical protein
MGKALDLEIMSVTAQVFPEGWKIRAIDKELIEDRGLWYCSEGNDLSDPNVVEDGVAKANITVFEVAYPASVAYAKRMWNDFTYLEYEANGNGLLAGEEESLKSLAAIAHALINRQPESGPFSIAVRFLVAWQTVFTPGCYGLDGWEEPEMEADIMGWVSLTLEGMSIVPLQTMIEEAKKPIPARGLPRPDKFNPRKFNPNGPEEEPPF